MALRWTAAVAIAAATATVAAAPIDPEAGDPERGALIASGGRGPVGATACFRCHGIDGSGDNAAAMPRLAGLDAYYLGKQLRDFAAGRRFHELMTPIARDLSAQDVLDVAAYYAELPPPPVPGPPTPAEALIEDGRRLFYGGVPEREVPSCALWHGAEGVSRAPAIPTLAGQHARYLEAQLHRWPAGLRDNDPLGMMTRIAAALSEEQIQAVAAFLASLPPAGTGS